jgi:hypothetical protein
MKRRLVGPRVPQQQSYCKPLATPDPESSGFCNLGI